jgi:hypothetical protein
MFSKAALEALERTHQIQVRSKDAELQRMKRDMDDALQRHNREQRVLIGVIHKIGMKTLGDHIENRLPKRPTSWLKIQRATLGQPVVSFAFPQLGSAKCTVATTRSLRVVVL